MMMLSRVRLPMKIGSGRLLAGGHALSFRRGLSVSGAGREISKSNKGLWMSGTLLGAFAGTVLFFRDSKPYHKFVDHIGMPLLRILDAETAHNAAVWAAANKLAPLDYKEDDPILKTRVWGIDFPNPVGLAAGFDKHAEAVNGLFNTGFGLVEIGSVTPLPQPGNPKPRMFRLVEDRAVINRYGFNSEGLEEVSRRLEKRREEISADPESFYLKNRRGVLGVNLGKNKTSTDAVQDYVTGINKLTPFADYLVINVSSPNTPGLRALQGKSELRAIVKGVQTALDKQKGQWKDGKRPPLLVKIAPDLVKEDKEDIAAVALETKIDGIIVSNTTISRPETLQSEHRGEIGGLSGAPLKGLAQSTLRDMYKLVGGKIPLVGVGGIEDGRDAYERIRSGASLVQMYSGLVYEGPGAVRRVKKELAENLRKDGFNHVQEAVGADVRS